MFLCVLVIIIWTVFVSPKLFPPPKRQPPPTQPQQQQPQQPTQPQPPTPTTQPDAEPEQTIPLKNDLVHAELTNRGASIKKLAITYKGKLVPLIDFPQNRTNSFVIKGLEHNWKVVSSDGTSVKFETTHDTIRHTLTYKLHPGKYLIDVNLEIRNESKERDVFKVLDIVAFSGIKEDRGVDERPYRYDLYLKAYIGLKATTDISYKAIAPGKPGEQKTHEEDDRRFVGLQNQYFTLALIPKPDAKLVRRFRTEMISTEEMKATADKYHLEGYRNFKVSLVTEERVLKKATDQQPGGFENYAFEIYAGPIDSNYLMQPSEDLRGMVQYGACCLGLGAIAHPIGVVLLWIINKFFAIFGNYGVAIAFTTIALRLAMFPINLKGQVSMFRMQQLQPKLELLKAKYKNDQKRMGQEVWKLYREHKINPLSGCFPLFITLPFFVAMYSVLNISIDFRQQPFFGWIQDLSRPDQLLDFGRRFDLWLFSIGAINLLPIVMSGTFLLQMMTAPKPQDPQMQMQQKMMMWAMPIMFLFITYEAAAGLSWYWFLSSLMAMGETKIIKKFFLKPISSTGS